MTIAGALYVNWHLHRTGSSRSLPADLGLASGIEFYRRELERQRDLLDTIWAWCLGPIIPGPVVFIVAYHLHIGLSLATTALVFVLVWMANQQAARKLQRRIDELNALEGQR